MNDRLKITERQQKEWDRFRTEQLEPCLATGGKEEYAMLKTLADAMRIMHESERRSIMFGEGLPDDGPCEISWEGQ